MKSKASIKGHPLHPILIAFPIAFFTGTLLFDILFLYTNDEHLFMTAMYMQIAGIAGAVLAAVPGIIDFLSVVPPKSSAKKRAAKHGLLNTIVLVIHAVVLYYRHDEFSITLLIGAEVVAMVLLLIAGWMGGTLVYKNQIAVVNRYASSGKWKESSVTGSGLVEVASADELKRDQMKLVHVNNKRIVIGRTENGYVAFDDHCTHKGGSLAGGMLICGTVQCPWHGSQFDVQTGAAVAGPATEGIRSYETREENGKVFLVVPSGM